MIARGRSITATQGISAIDITAFAVLAIAGTTMIVVDRTAVSLVLLLVGFVAGVASPTAAVAAIGAAAPFVYQPVTLKGGSFSVLELAIGIAACGVGLHILIEVWRAKSVAPIMSVFTPLPLTGAAVLLLAVGALSLFYVADLRYRPDSIRSFRWTIVEPIIAFLLYRWCVRRPGGRFAVLAAFLSMGTLVAIAGGIRSCTAAGLSSPTGSSGRPVHTGIQTIWRST